MIESLHESIEALREDDFSGSWGKWDTIIYLDPDQKRVYTFLKVGPGEPIGVYHRIHMPLLTVSPGAIAESVFQWVASVEDRLVEALGGFVGSEFDGHNFIGQWSRHGLDILSDISSQDAHIASYWDACEWFEEDDLKPLWREGKTPEEIIDQQNCGDELNGMVDRDEAIKWLTDRIKEWEADRNEDVSEG